MRPRQTLDRIPWWEVRGNPLLRKLEGKFLRWGAWFVEDHRLQEQSYQDAKHRRIDSYYHYDRSFVLEKIRWILIKPLERALSKEEIIQLVEEAYDFDLEAYKREWYQTHPRED